MMNSVPQYNVAGARPGAPMSIPAVIQEALRLQPVPQGWQQSVPITDRVRVIVQLLSSLRLAQPQQTSQADLYHAAMQFELAQFRNAQDKAHYDAACLRNLAQLHSQMHDQRPRNMAALQQPNRAPQGIPGANQVHPPMQAAIAGPGRGHPAFPPQLQRPMQASPIPGSQPPARIPVSSANLAPGGAAASAAIGGQASFTPHQPPFPPANNQPRPAPPPVEPLTREENAEINMLAAQMMKNTPAAGIQRVHEIVATYPEDVRNRLTRSGISLVKYHFRQMAERYWRDKHNRPPTARPAATTAAGGAGGLRAPIPPPNPAAGAASLNAFVGNVENLAGQQAAQARSAAERGQLVVPANTGPRPNQGQIGNFVGPGVVGLSPDTSGGIHPTQTAPTPQHQLSMARNLAHMAQQQKLQQAVQQLQAQPAKVAQNAGATSNSPATVGQGGQQPGPGVQQQVHPSVRPPQARIAPSAPNTPQLSHTPSQAADAHLAEHGAPTPQHFDPMTHSSPPVNQVQRAPSQKNVQMMNPQQLRQFMPAGPSQAPLSQFQQPPQPAQQPQQPAMMRADGSVLVSGQAPSPHQQTPPSAGPAGSRMQRSTSNTASAPTMSQADAIAQRHLTPQQIQPQQPPQAQPQPPGRTYPRPPSVPPLGVDEQRFMDSLPFPRGFLKGSDNFPPFPAPDNIQRWGELKSWAAQNPQLMHPASAEWLSAIQTSHYLQIKNRQQAGSDQPPHVGAMHPSTAQAPLPTATLDGQAKVSVPVSGPQMPGLQVPGIGLVDPVTEQDIALARAKLREMGKQALNDDQLRYLIHNHRVQAMQRKKELEAQADQISTQQLPATPPAQGSQLEQPVPQQQPPPPPPQPQRRPPSTASQLPRQPPAVQHKIPDAGPEPQSSAASTRSAQVQPRRAGPQTQPTPASRGQAASSKASRQGPAGRGVTAAPSPPQAPPRGIKRPADDEDVETGEKSGASQPQTAPPMQTAASHVRVDLTKEMSPASAASPEQLMPSGPMPGQGVSQAQMNFSPESVRLRELYREVGVALSTRPPVAMNEEARSQLVKELNDIRNYIRPIDHSLLGFMRAAKDEKGITELVKSRQLIMQQFLDGALRDAFTISLEEFKVHKYRLVRCMAFMRGQSRGPAPAQNAPQPNATQPAVPVPDMRPAPQQPSVPQDAPKIEQPQARPPPAAPRPVAQPQTDRRHQAPPPAPTTTQPPFQFGAPSPHGVPQRYGGTGLTAEKLKPPPAKRRKNQKGAEAVVPAPTSDAVGTTSVTPPKNNNNVAEKPTTADGKTDQAPAQLPAEPARPHKCPVVECDFHVKGFTSAEDLEKHRAEKHEEPEAVVTEKVTYTLQNMATVFEVDADRVSQTTDGASGSHSGHAGNQFSPGTGESAPKAAGAGVPSLETGPKPMEVDASSSVPHVAKMFDSEPPKMDILSFYVGMGSLEDVAENDRLGHDQDDYADEQLKPVKWSIMPRDSSTSVARNSLDDSRRDSFVWEFDGFEFDDLKKYSESSKWHGTFAPWGLNMDMYEVTA